jgi:hypothetical protein
MTTFPPMNLSAISALVLARLLVAGDKAQSASQIKKDFEPLLAHRLVGEILSERIDRTLAELEASGLVTQVRAKSKKAAIKILLTVDGRRQGLRFLGLAQLKPKTTWAAIKKTHLPACALGISDLSDATIKALSADTGFKAMLLTKQFKLPLAGCPTLKDATGTLFWKLIGFDSTKPFSVTEVQKALLDRELGDNRPANSKKAIDRLLAQCLGARCDDSKELRTTVVRGWIDQEDFGEKSPPSPESPPLEFNLSSFAERVKAAARGCTTGRFGDSRVFIVHVWRAFESDQSESAFRSIDLAAFKGHLTEANNARLLDLSRADLVQAMDPDDIRESEVRYLNATFHFVRI